MHEATAQSVVGWYQILRTSASRRRSTTKRVRRGRYILGQICQSGPCGKRLRCGKAEADSASHCTETSPAMGRHLYAVLGTSTWVATGAATRGSQDLPERDGTLKRWREGKRKNGKIGEMEGRRMGRKTTESSTSTIPAYASLKTLSPTLIVQLRTIPYHDLDDVYPSVNTACLSVHLQRARHISPHIKNLTVKAIPSTNETRRKYSHHKLLNLDLPTLRTLVPLTAGHASAAEDRTLIT